MKELQVWKGIMPRFGRGETARFKQERRRGYALLASIDDHLPHRQSFSYQKLPEQLLKLSILKLDGSCFDVQISRSATVAELKLVVEKFFSQPPEGEGYISWNHVWGHFCLCYDDHKLINDKESLQSFGIKDGDQLLFQRHLSINYNIMKKRCFRNHKKSHDLHTMSLTDEKCDNGKDDLKNNLENKSIVRNNEFKLGHFFKGWLSCARRIRLEGWN